MSGISGMGKPICSSDERADRSVDQECPSVRVQSGSFPRIVDLAGRGRHEGISGRTGWQDGNSAVLGVRAEGLCRIHAVGNVVKTPAGNAGAQGRAPDPHRQGQGCTPRRLAPARVTESPAPRRRWRIWPCRRWGAAGPTAGAEFFQRRRSDAAGGMGGLWWSWFVPRGRRGRSWSSWVSQRQPEVPRRAAVSPLENPAASPLGDLRWVKS